MQPSQIIQPPPNLPVTTDTWEPHRGYPSQPRLKTIQLTYRILNWIKCFFVVSHSIWRWFVYAAKTNQHSRELALVRKISWKPIGLGTIRKFNCFGGSRSSKWANKKPNPYFLCYAFYLPGFFGLFWPLHLVLDPLLLCLFLCLPCQFFIPQVPTPLHGHGAASDQHGNSVFFSLGFSFHFRSPGSKVITCEKHFGFGA